MFKFLKSKKGFTLVELMIVVVIMAILVAVAVPIYSAVTANARKKTCIGNQREIVSSVGNWLMLHEKSKAAGTFSITTEGTDNGKFSAKYTSDAGATALTDEEYAQIVASFKTVPFCPEEGGVITVTIQLPAANLAGGFSTVKTACNHKDSADKLDHVLNQANA